MKRYEKNPIIQIQDVKPSREDFKVDGVFNCGTAKYDGEILLLCRVAESVVTEDSDVVKIPIVVQENGIDKIDIIRYDKNKRADLEFNDSRHVNNTRGQIVNLTSLSHLRLARSKDGVHFILEDTPAISLTAEEESWGMEDPRITQIGDVYYINYTSVTKNGAATSLISTKNFKDYTRHGVIFAPENKDVTIFPEKIGGMYWAFNRPVPKAIGKPDMWLAKSPDLIHWGEQKHFCGISDADQDAWDNGRIGGGAVPFLTDRGWVVIYHAADKCNRYCLGAFLLDKENPLKVLGRANKPILEPEADYEKYGFFGNVVFTCGCIVEGGNVNIYYGAADDKICLAVTTVEELLNLIS